MGSARRDLRKFPKAVRNSIGLDLYAVQCGMTPDAAKPFKGLKGVMEIVERYATDAYRALYVATLDDTVYVLHYFKKKSKHGVKTPQADIDVVTQRYKQARVLAR